MSFSTQVIGNATELKCIAKFIELGYECSIPYGNSAKYDFIVDDGQNLYKMQCKTAQEKQGEQIYYNKIVIYLYSTSKKSHKNTCHLYSNEDVDYFVTYFQDNIYTIPIKNTKNQKTFTLRLGPTLNGQKCDINYASDFFFN